MPEVASEFVNRQLGSDTRTRLPVVRTGCRLAQAVEQPELCFYFALLGAEDVVFTGTAVGRGEFTFTPDADGDLLTRIVPMARHCEYLMAQHRTDSGERECGESPMTIVKG